MANEELIYRITRAVYDRLGASADENTVEQLVTDIYRAVEPSIARNGAASSAPTVSAPRPFGERDPREGSSDRLIISVFGVDHPGIVAGVAEILSEAQCSIVDINQTVVQRKFAMVIIADASRSKLPGRRAKGSAPLMRYWLNYAGLVGRDSGSGGWEVFQDPLASFGKLSLVV